MLFWAYGNKDLEGIRRLAKTMWIYVLLRCDSSLDCNAGLLGRRRQTDAELVDTLFWVVYLFLTSCTPGSAFAP
jgi:hypothetical protein